MERYRENAEKGEYIATKDTKAQVARARELKRRIDRDTKELNQIKADLRDEMDNLGVMRYVDGHGAVLVTVFDRENSRFDRKAAESVLGAKVLDKFTVKSVSQVLTIK